MESPGKWDVVIIGGGPAGSCAGAYLARQGWRVCILEKCAFPRFRIGESLLPQGNTILQRIGVWEKFEQGGFLQKHGAEFTTPDRSHTVHNRFAVNGFVPGNPYTYQVERARFDALLLDHARACGCEVRMETAVTSVLRIGEGWKVDCRSTGVDAILSCNWLLDASGREACLARLMKHEREPLPYPKRIAVYAHYRGIPLQAGTLSGNIVITRLPGGWSWNIPLSAGKTSIGMVTLLSDFQQHSLEPEVYFHKIRDGSPYLRDLMGNAERVGEVHTTADYSTMHREFTGEKHVLIGDAAAFIDPIFSSGLYLAMTSALEAADLLLRAGKQGTLKPSTQRQYTARMKRRIRVMRDLIEAFYDDDGFAVFMRPTNRFGLFAGVGTVVAGNTDLTWNLRWRFELFKLICRLNRRFHFVPRLDGRKGVVSRQ
ncbi:MAG: NAD(P)/FAD-dependent oxidoreductase [Verrucomicrobiota bacterium]|nr:NAD(P)/FAD-dependent oxidoreductase [Verrucomicrobiota bacterium]